jgi:hypothetical protein
MSTVHVIRCLTFQEAVFRTLRISNISQTTDNLQLIYIILSQVFYLRLNGHIFWDCVFVTRVLSCSILTPTLSVALDWLIEVLIIPKFQYYSHLNYSISVFREGQFKLVDTVGFWVTTLHSLSSSPGWKMEAVRCPKLLAPLIRQHGVLTQKPTWIMKTSDLLKFAFHALSLCCSMSSV